MADPERQCIGCGQRGPQTGLVRLGVADEDGVRRVVVVVERKEHRGRSAYLCKRQACLERAVLRKAFQRAFRSSVEVDKGCLAAAVGVFKGE